MKRHLNNWIASYVEYTDNTEPPKMYRKWVAVSCVAAALQRKVWIPWGKGTTWYPNFYICLVAPSGKARKSTAMRTGESLLRDLGVKMASEAITREALIRELTESGTIDVDEDGNSLPHCSLTVFSKELTVFLGDQNKRLIMDLTDWYDCADHWVYRTKTQGTDELNGVFLNLLGASTPHSLKSNIPEDSIGGGFTSRMIFIYQSKKGKRIYHPWKVDEDEVLRNKLLEDLEQMNSLMGRFTITENLAARWKPWYEDIDENPPIDHRRFAGYNQRRPSHTMKLAMVLAASKRNDLVISWNEFREADVMLSEAEKKMPQTFFGMGRDKSSDTIREMIDFIARKKETTIADLMRHFHADVGGREQLRELLDGLSTRNFIDINEVYTENGSQSTSISVNTDSKDYKNLYG